MSIELKKKIIFSLFILGVILIAPQDSNAQTDSLQVHIVSGKKYYIHIIKKGDSLYAIHKKYNVPIGVLKKENPSVLDGLSIGEKVFVPIKRDNEIEIKVDGNFIDHKVKKKQTLYSIAKLYKVKQKEIIAANPSLVNGLKEGEVIKIPVSNINKDEKIKPEIISTIKHNTHTVQQGETFYSLSKLYHTTADSIKLINNGLKQGLKTGETIYIPNTNTVATNPLNKDTTNNIASISATINSLINDTTIFVKKSEYKIALMLPFYLDENDERTQHKNALQKKSIYPKSKFAIEFYNGFTKALDSISTDSCKFKLYVYDTKGNDSLRTKSILLKPEMNDIDLIVGPLYYNNFKSAAKFAQQHKIPVVSPIKQNNKLLLGNPFIFKAIPSKSTSIKQLCALVVDSFKTENLIAIKHQKSKEKSLVELYLKTYNNQILNLDDTIIYSAIKTLEINTNMDGIVGQLQMNKNNVIFIPTSDQTFITKLLNHLTTTLSKRLYKNYKVTLIGLEEWRKFENIDLSYFQKLNVHYCSTRFIETNDSLTAGFIKNYVNQTETYPSKNTFLGFDIAYYFGNNLINYGTLFSSAALEEYKGMSIDLNFFKTGIESGFENTSSYVLKFDDYSLKKIDVQSRK